LDSSAEGNYFVRIEFSAGLLGAPWKFENITDEALHRGYAGGTADQHHFIDLIGPQMRIAQCVSARGDGPGDDGYELQVLDSYENKTYVNGMAGSLYKQAIPLANPTRKPGEWQTYDVVWTAPTFNGDGSVKTPAYATVLFNGVLVENHFELKGQTLYIGKPFYKAYTSAPIKLQAHGDKSEPISFRNIWIRELP